METTRTDVASLTASILGFALAAYGLLTQPLIVDSTRPTQTVENTKPGNALTVPARLWDDPFIVYPDTPVYPDRPKQSELQPRSISKTHQKSLLLVVPEHTQLYEEDKETRLRMRFAVQRALLDQGYAPVRAQLLDALEFDLSEFEGTVKDSQTKSVSNPSLEVPAIALRKTTPSQCGAQGKCRIPLQLFELRPLAQEPFELPDTSHYSLVTLVWLPDELIQADKVGNLVQLLKDRVSILGTDAQAVVLGPQDSDTLAYLLTPITQHQANESSSRPTPFVSYGATIAEPILGAILNTRGNETSILNILLRMQENSQHLVCYETKEASIVRLPTRDDNLCYKLLKEIVDRRVLGVHSNTINIWVFAEWDTLYGRSLADTFKSYAASTEQPEGISSNAYLALNTIFAKRPPMFTDVTRNSSINAPLAITVVPYLRGLDGASSLYRSAYIHTPEDKSAEKASEVQKSNLTVEPAEGTTQFDYIRRLTNSMLGPHVPFVPQLQRPDAVVIFGTDVYDKLVLLKFLRQVLRNCAYYTTDLDALYWHPHYIQYTKDLVVASEFPLTITPNICLSGGLRGSTINASVTFRDSYQASVYWGVRKVVQGTNVTCNEALFAFPDKPSLYRIGNSVPIALEGMANTSQASAEANFGDSFQRLLRELNSWAGGLIEPIIQGASPFWAILVQLIVVTIGVLSLSYDIRKRVTLSVKARDELWKTALSFVPVIRDKDFDLHKELNALREVVQKAREERPYRVAKRSVGMSGDFRRYGSIVGTKDVTASAKALIEHYQKALLQAGTKKDVTKIAFNLFSDIFSFRRTGRRLENLDCQEHEPDVKPFVDYVARDFFSSFEPKDLTNGAKNKFVDRIWAVFNNLFPTLTFKVVAAIAFLVLVLICIQPIPFLVGPETRSYQMRIFKWVVEASALFVTFCVFYRVCFEQWRFLHLVKELRDLITQETGLSNRQLVLLIADASVPVANLSLTPCALVFLLFISHMVPLGGVPLTLETFGLLFGSLCVLTLSFSRLRSAALRARAQVRLDYDNDRLVALRLLTRLKSFATDKEPIQDDSESLIQELENFVRRNSTSPQAESVEGVYRKLGVLGIRQRICEYLESCTRRNSEIIQQLGSVSGGVLAPLWVNPIISALLIPVGGAGGISLIAWLISQVR